jgi:hypothetical protein
MVWLLGFMALVTLGVGVVVVVEVRTWGPMIYAEIEELRLSVTRLAAKPRERATDRGDAQAGHLVVRPKTTFDVDRERMGDATSPKKNG